MKEQPNHAQAPAETSNVEKPKRREEFVAIEELTTPEEINNFYNGYLRKLEQDGEGDESKRTAAININHALLYYGDGKKTKLWQKTLGNKLNAIE